MKAVMSLFLCVCALHSHPATQKADSSALPAFVIDRLRCEVDSVKAASKVQSGALCLSLAQGRGDVITVDGIEYTKVRDCAAQNDDFGDCIKSLPNATASRNQLVVLMGWELQANVCVFKAVHPETLRAKCFYRQDKAKDLPPIFAGRWLLQQPLFNGQIASRMSALYITENISTQMLPISYADMAAYAQSLKSLIVPHLEDSLFCAFQDAGIDLARFVVGISLQFANSEDVDQVELSRVLPRVMARMKMQDKLERQLVDVITDRHLDCYNRLCILSLARDYAELLQDAEHRIAFTAVLNTAVQTLPKYLHEQKMTR